MTNGFTPTERALWRVLKDGYPHGKAELMACLQDELTEVGTLHTHISNMRRRLRPNREDIICVNANRQNRYQWVKVMWDDADLL